MCGSDDERSIEVGCGLEDRLVGIAGHHACLGVRAQPLSNALQVSEADLARAVVEFAHPRLVAGHLGHVRSRHEDQAVAQCTAKGGGVRKHPFGQLRAVERDDDGPT